MHGHRLTESRVRQPALSDSVIRRRWAALHHQDGLSARVQGLSCLIAMLVIFARRPDVLLNPQFFAEDGTVWFAQAYSRGWLQALVLPHGGYLVVLERLGASFALLFPFHLAPLVMNLVGMVVQVAPLFVLLSRRAAPWGSLQMRGVFAVIYVLLPNTAEIHVNLTNAQWHWAFLMILLAFSAPPKSWLGRVTDLLVLLIGSATGPFCLLILPSLLVFAWLRRRVSSCVTDRVWPFILAATILPITILQASFVHATVRMVDRPLGATPALFLRLFGEHVFFETLVGASRFAPRLPLAIAALLAAFGIMIVIQANRYANINLRLFTLFSAGIFAASLKTPLVGGSEPLWQSLLLASGARYWFFPMLAFIWSLLWCSILGPKWSQIAGRAATLLMCLAIVRQFHYRSPDDHQFPLYAAHFERLKPGQQIVIPIYPNPWSMTLTRK